MGQWWLLFGSGVEATLAVMKLIAKKTIRAARLEGKGYQVSPIKKSLKVKSPTVATPTSPRQHHVSDHRHHRH